MSDSGGDHRDGRLFVSLILVGVVVFAVSVATGTALGAEPGSLADWLAAVSTFAALLAAAYAAVQTSRTLSLELDRDRLRDQDRRQAQAELVAVWSGTIESQGPRITLKVEPGKVPVETKEGVCHPISIPVTVRNASPLPVHEVHVEIYFQDTRDGSWVLGGRHLVVDDASGIAIVGTREDMEIMTPDMVESMVPVLERLPGADAGPIPIGIGWSFRDNAGQRWRRGPGRPLAPIDSPG